MRWFGWFRKNEVKEKIKALSPLADDKVIRCLTRLRDMYKTNRTYTSADRRMIQAYKTTLLARDYPAPENEVDANRILSHFNIEIK